METETARDWALAFEGKSEAEIADTWPPRDATGPELVRWKLAQQAAGQAARQRAADAQASAASDDAGESADYDADCDIDEDDRARIDMQHLTDNLLERLARAQSDLAVPAHPEKFPHLHVTQNNEPLIRPIGDAAQLLEHQLASSAALMGYLAHFIARPDTDPQTCISFMDRMALMIGASAQLGKVVGRLRGNISETRQTITVKREATRKGVGEGVLES